MVDTSLSARVYIINSASMVIFSLPLLYWRSMRIHSIFDQALRWLFVLYIISSVVRLVLLLPQSQVSLPEHFTQTWYWLGVHVLCMALGMLGASAIFFAVLGDVLEELRTDSNMDALTEVLNRRGWNAREQKLQQQESADTGRSYALLLVDLDHFKRINDSLGHAVGDRVLMQTARLLKRQVRGQDLVCRHGGEEFVVLLVGATLHIAQQVAERICKQMQALDLPMLKGQIVTMSIGVAALQSLQPADMAQAMEMA
ncbi:MAG: GGDEF domain-containing protein, partial [Comamonas sp.]